MKKTEVALHEFQTDYIYMNFLSLNGCSVKITVRFPKDDEENENKMNQK